MEAYKTLARTGQAEILIKKSRFIGQASPVACEDEAREFVASIKAAHRLAAHNVWAWSLREGQLRRYSDDGEPQGTAGLPTLDVLQKRALADCAVVVTRYFGGILLGAGGLVRAYSQAAGAAVEAAGVVTMAPCKVLRLRCDYGFYGKLQTFMPATLDIDFAENITVTLRLREEDADSFIAKVTDLSNGLAACEVLREEFAGL